MGEDAALRTPTHLVVFAIEPHWTFDRIDLGQVGRYIRKPLLHRSCRVVGQGLADDLADSSDDAPVLPGVAHHGHGSLQEIQSGSVMSVYEDWLQGL